MSNSTKDISQIVEEVAKGYDYREPPGILVKLQELISTAIRVVYDFLNSFNSGLGGVGDTSVIGNLLQMLLVVIGAVCVVLVAYLLWKRMRQMKAQRQFSSKGGVILELELDSKGWQTEAERLSTNKEYREALRALYFSFLRRLDEGEILKFSPTRTNYEYWYALSKNKQMQREFRELADVVEDSWFGWHEPGPQDYQKSLETLRALDSHVSAEIAARPPVSSDQI